MESIRAWEIAGNIAQSVYNVGSFVVGHLKGGAWGDTASEIQPASIQYEPERGSE